MICAYKLLKVNHIMVIIGLKHSSHSSFTSLLLYLFCIKIKRTTYSNQFLTISLYILTIKIQFCGKLKYVIKHLNEISLSVLQ